MATNKNYVKTEKGHAEVSTRGLALPPRVRAILIRTDGKLTDEVLTADAIKVGAPADVLAQLEAQGLIERAGGAVPVSAAVTAAAIAAPTVAAASGVATAEPQDIPADDFGKFRAAKKLMTDAVVSAGGMKSFLFTMKLERLSNLDDVRNFLPTFREYIAKASGFDAAQSMTANLEALLK